MVLTFPFHAGTTSMIELSQKMTEAIYEETGAVYTYADTIGYPTAGTSRDWFYSDDANELNDYRPASYTIELRDTGEYAFFLPPEQVSSTAAS